MKKLTCTLFLGLVAIRSSAAAEAPAQPEAPVAEVATIELKHKSSFSLDEGGRNPFWPIGWKPAAKQSNNNSENAGPEIQPTSFLVTSITVDQGARYAIINGKAMTEGQVFGLQFGNQTYQITVKAIQDGQVILLRRDQEIAVPLRRR